MWPSRRVRNRLHVGDDGDWLSQATPLQVGRFGGSFSRIPLGEIRVRGIGKSPHALRFANRCLEPAEFPDRFQLRSFLSAQRKRPGTMRKKSRLMKEKPRSRFYSGGDGIELKDVLRERDSA